MIKFDKLRKGFTQIIDKLMKSLKLLLNAKTLKEKNSLNP